MVVRNYGDVLTWVSGDGGCTGLFMELFHKKEEWLGICAGGGRIRLRARAIISETYLEGVVAFACFVKKVPEIHFMSFN